MAKDKSDMQTLAELGSKAPVRAEAPGPSLSAKDLKASAASENNTLEELQRAVEEKRRCTGYFRLTQPHYRLGRMYEPGDVLHLKNDVPGKTWVPFDPKATTAVEVPVIGNPGSAVEQDI